ncbi:MAG: hypothetical protein P8Q99_00810 [Paracoccaceae bacterium]|nr:hypothetical protein [Paracoccaceae bacterium]
MKSYYVIFYIVLGGGALGFAFLLYSKDLPFTADNLLERLYKLSTDEGSDAEDIRNLAYAFGAIAASLAVLATLPFQIIKVWINERIANNTEQGQITDRINKAVEGLGASKDVTFQRKDANGILTYGKHKNGKPDFTNPIIVTESQPNLEVRTGAIFALERISQDSLRDHVQIMEILTAYIRENAKIGEIPETPWDDWRAAGADVESVPE